jgi:kynurenine formamidase
VTRVVDLSPTVPDGFHGPPSTDLGVRLDVATKPGYWQSTRASLNVHSGCHVESELHVVEGGEAIDALALERVIGSAVLLDLGLVEPRALVDVAALEAAERQLGRAGERIRTGDILLLRTGWSDRALGSSDYFRLSPALTAEAAAWLVAREPRCVGCDFLEEPAAREPGWQAPEFVVHRAILGARIPLVENLVGLDALPARCQFYAPFFKLGGVEAAPARAFAVVSEADA